MAEGEEANKHSSGISLRSEGTIEQQFANLDNTVQKKAEGTFKLMQKCEEVETDLQFEQLIGSSIWHNKKCLDKGYTPIDVKIMHRKKEIETYMRHLSDALQNIVPGNLFIYGKIGTGKTMITKLVTSQLEKKALEYGVKVKAVYIQCEASSTNTAVFRVINNSLMVETGMEITKTANSFNIYFMKFCQLMKRLNGILIIIFDEIDKLDNPDILNLLSRVKESGFLDENVCIIGITNDIGFEENLDARTMSVLSRTNIIFSPYNANQLRDILQQRAEMAFKPGVLEEAVIPICAAYAAQEHGDARKALELLRVGGIIAVERGEKKVTEEHVKIAKDRIEQDKATEIIRTLPTHSKLVLASCIINLSKETSYKSHTGEIYNTYKDFCMKVGLEVMTQRRITDFLSELSALGLINAITICKGRHGRTKEVTLAVTMGSALDVLVEDYRLKSLKDTLTHGKRMETLSQGHMQMF